MSFDINHLIRQKSELEEAITANDARLQKVEAQIKALREVNAELLESAKGVIAGFDAGVFVRNTANDRESSWAIKAFPHLRQLGKLVEVVAKSEKLK